MSSIQDIRLFHEAVGTTTSYGPRNEEAESGFGLPPEMRTGEGRLVG